MTWRCSDCGYKIRGKNHEEGSHHKKSEGPNGKKRVPKSKRKKT